MNYWIFQCKPDAIVKDVDIETAIRNKHPFFSEWGVRQYKDDIRKGDKAIIWITGKDARCVALIDIASNPEVKTDNSLFEVKNQTGKRLKSQNDKVVSINAHYIPKSVLKDKVKRTKGLENFNAGRPGSYGTNLTLDKSEYDIIRALSEIDK